MNEPRRIQRQESVNDTSSNLLTAKEKFHNWACRCHWHWRSYGNVSPLPVAVKNDARDVAADSYIQCPTVDIKPSNVHLLLDEDATLARIRTALDSVAKASQSE